jgi:hypothetical protein
MLVLLLKLISLNANNVERSEKEGKVAGRIKWIKP